MRTVHGLFLTKIGKRTDGSKTESGTVRYFPADKSVVMAPKIGIIPGKSMPGGALSADRTVRPFFPAGQAAGPANGTCSGSRIYLKYFIICRFQGSEAVVKIPINLLFFAIVK